MNDKSTLLQKDAGLKDAGINFALNALGKAF